MVQRSFRSLTAGMSRRKHSDCPSEHLSKDLLGEGDSSATQPKCDNYPMQHANIREHHQRLPLSWQLLTVKTRCGDLGMYLG